VPRKYSGGGRLLELVLQTKKKRPDGVGSEKDPVGGNLLRTQLPSTEPSTRSSKGIRGLAFPVAGNLEKEGE